MEFSLMEKVKARIAAWRAGLILCLAAATCSIAPSASAADFSFARASAGQDILLADEEFYTQLSKADIAIRLQAEEGEPTLADLKASYGQGVEDWTTDEIIAITKVIMASREALDPYADLLPKTIFLVKINKRVEGGMPHTRANAIFFDPTEGPFDQGVLYHEIFHILSRHEKERRESLYAILDFHKCTLQGTQAFEDRRMTNPDTPPGAEFVRLNEQSEKGANAVVAHTFAARRYFDPSAAQGFGGHIGFGLVPVVEKDGVCAPVLSDGKVVVESANAYPEFFEAIGRNTPYIIHPEEVLADNFTFLLQGRKDLPNPEILDSLKAWLDKG